MPIGVVGLYSPRNGINAGGPAVLFPRVCLVLRLLSLVIPVDLGSLMSSLLSVLQFALLPAALLPKSVVVNVANKRAISRVDFLPKPPKLLLCECWP